MRDSSPGLGAQGRNAERGIDLKGSIGVRVPRAARALFMHGIPRHPRLFKDGLVPFLFIRKGRVAVSRYPVLIDD